MFYPDIYLKGLEENHEKPESGYPILRQIFQRSAFRVRVLTVPYRPA
jgi:hypothetical protein